MLKQIKSEFVPFFMAFIAVGTIIGFLVFPTDLYYIALALFAIAGLSGGNFNINWHYIILFFGAFLSLVTNDAAPIFRAWERLFFFILISIPISPFLTSGKLYIYRLRALKYMLVFSVIIGIGSFAAYLLGINYMVNFIDGNNTVTNVGWFGGITVHSMLLGPTTALGATFAMWYMTGTTFKNILYKYMSYGFVFACFASTLLSASRSSSLACIVGCTIVYIYRNGMGKSNVLTGLIGLLLIGVLLQPLIEPFAQGVLVKQNANVEAGSIFSSREGKWVNRLEEFVSNPIVGSGFATVNVHSDDYSNNGIIEPGTSWLAVLSMLGIIGVFCIYKIVFAPIMKLYRSGPNRTGILLLGLFAVFFLHMMTEGYIFAGGNFMFFYFWLYIGALHAYLNDPTFEILEQ